MEKIMDLVNGFKVAWKKVKKIGKQLVVNAIAAGKKLRIVYSKETHLVDDVTSADRDLADAVYEGVKATSGTWSDNAGNSIAYGNPTAGNTVPKKSVPTGRKNQAHVYFWTRKLKDGRIIYCHSRKLCEADPMGQALYKEWVKNPAAYMAAHPELCR